MKEIDEIKLSEIKDWLVKDLDEDIFEVTDSHITYEKSVDTFKVGDLEKLPKDMKSFIQGMILGYEIGARGACEHLDIKVIDDTTIVKTTPQSEGVVEEAKG